MSVQINKLEIENVKRVHAVKMEPARSGLTVIGGNNGQGKTSVLDAIAWALGGNTFKPSNATNDSSVLPPYLRVVLSNGLVVERKGKNSSLVVTDPNGEKAGQDLLDSFVSKLALDLPKFMNANDSDKAKILLNILGIGPELAELNQKETEIYNERTAIGRVADQKIKFAKEQPYYPDAPHDLVSASDLIKQQQDILARNAQRQQWIADYESIMKDLLACEEAIDQTKAKLHQLEEQKRILTEKSISAQKSPNDLKMESTAELERNIADVEEINRKVRANMDKDKADDDAALYGRQYNMLTNDLEEVRAKKKALLEHADLPLPGLSVEDGKLVYNGQRWDCMSGADQLKVATAIVRRLNPNCGFVLMDKLEQMDLTTLQEFGAWLEEEGLQVIATRVSTGSECSIIITDGFGSTKEEPEPEAPAAAPARTWKKGEF